MPLTSIEACKWEGTRGGVVARRGRPDLSPAWPFCTAVVRVATVPPRWEGGGEDAPVGKGPRRTRPHPGARTKYIAPVEVHGGGSACGFLETGGLWIGLFGCSSGCLFAVGTIGFRKGRRSTCIGWML